MPPLEKKRKCMHLNTSHYKSKANKGSFLYNEDGSSKRRTLCTN